MRIYMMHYLNPVEIEQRFKILYLFIFIHNNNTHEKGKGQSSRCSDASVTLFKSNRKAI